MSEQKYEQSRVPIKSLAEGDIVIPPQSFASMCVITAFFECELKPGWYHMFLEGIEDALIRIGEAYADGETGITLCTPNITYYHNMTGKDWLAKVKETMH